MNKHPLFGAIIIASVLCIHSKTFSQTDWHTTGNSGTTSDNFLGTTDSKPVVLRTKNIEQMRITIAGRVGIGTNNPLQKLDVNGNINIRKNFGLYMDNHKVLRIDSASGNIFLGNNTGDRNSSSFNTGIGYQAFFSNTSGGYNTATGYQALYANYAGFYNTATGVLSLYSNTTGSYNVASGNYSLLLSTTGNYNTATGYSALSSNRTASGNTAQGSYALYYNTTGTENVGIGKNALYKNSTGDYNTAIGTEALYQNTAGYNAAAGYHALHTNTSGYDNAAFGFQGMVSNTTGVQNTSIGSNAMYSNSYGSYNTALGAYALFNTSGSSNNTAVGDIAGTSYENGWNNTFVGAYADATGPNIYNSIAIGNVSRVSAPNQVRIGNSSTTSIGGYAGWSTISDARVKQNIRDNVPGLAFINKLKAVTYNLDLDAADKFMYAPGLKQKDARPQELSKADIAARKLKQEVVYTGFLAQEVEKAAKELNYNFSGVDAAKNDKDLYSLRYSEFVVPLVKAVQELSRDNDKLKKENQAQQKLNDELLQRLEKLESIMNVQSPGTNSKLQVTGLSEASLQQNNPNPFNRTTTINYTLPKQHQTAKIIITDKSARTIKEINLPAGRQGVTGNGKNSLTVDASSLSAGSYQYSLYVDGRLISSKQMILAK